MLPILAPMLLLLSLFFLSAAMLGTRAHLNSLLHHFNFLLTGHIGLFIIIWDDAGVGAADRPDLLLFVITWIYWIFNLANIRISLWARWKCFCTIIRCAKLLYDCFSADSVTLIAFGIWVRRWTRGARGAPFPGIPSFLGFFLFRSDSDRLRWKPMIIQVGWTDRRFLLVKFEINFISRWLCFIN